jgi:signal transduction histidine kinase
MTEDDKARHDFKNQLAIIQGFTEILLAETAADDPHRRDLEEIRRAALTALSRLVQIFPELP